MKKFAALLLAALLLFLPVSCAAADENKPYQHDPVTYTLVVADPAQYIRPVKNTYSAEEQEKLDDFYTEAIKRYPCFAEFPRDMLQETIEKDEERGLLYVRFSYYLGGVDTSCSCEYSGPGEADRDMWCETAGFLRYATLGVTEAQMREIHALLLEQVLDAIDYYHLQKTDDVADQIYIYWRIDRDGALYAASEYIAHYAEPKTPAGGCGVDHEHIMAKVRIEVVGE